MSNLQTKRKLISLDEMLGNSDDADKNKIPAFLPIKQLHPKKNHRFQINLGNKNTDLLQSIKEFGVLEPIIVRPLSDHMENEEQTQDQIYEILAGHRRTAMAKEAGLAEVPVVIKTGLTEAEADLIETETNLLQRSWEDMSHSERAEVLNAHYNAIHQKGVREGFLEEINAEIQSLANPVNSMAEEGLSQVETKGNLRSSGEAYELSKDTVARYLRIYTLSTELKERMDMGEIAFMAGFEISYLTQEHQTLLENMLDDYKLSLRQAKDLRKLEIQGKLTENTMQEILAGKQLKKAGRPKAFRIQDKIISRFFSEGTKEKEIEEIIVAALEEYFKER